VEEEDEERWEALAWNAQQLADSGDLIAAEAQARSVPSATKLTGYFHEKVCAYVHVAAALLKAGQRERGEALLREAEAMAPALQGGVWEVPCALYDIGLVWYRSGGSQEAVRLWEHAVRASRHPSDANTFKTLASIARYFRVLNLEDRVPDIVGLLPTGYPWERDSGDGA
jgi:hypothetical protein